MKNKIYLISTIIFISLFQAGCSKNDYSISEKNIPVKYNKKTKELLIYHKTKNNYIKFNYSIYKNYKYHCDSDSFRVLNTGKDSLRIVIPVKNKPCKDFEQGILTENPYYQNLLKIDETILSNITITKLSGRKSKIFSLIKISNKGKIAYIHDYNNKLSKKILNKIKPKRKFDKNGLDKNGFNIKNIHFITKSYFSPFGYDFEGYNTNLYNKKGIHKITHEFHDEYGFYQDGYNLMGRDKYGLDKEGFSVKLFNKKGIHKTTGTYFNENGYDKNGFDKFGYTYLGYDRKGLDKSGFNRKGFNKLGINNLTNTRFNKKGYDKDGFNKNNFNKYGYNKNGFNKKGYDINGFNKNGININGYDIKGNKKY